MNPLLLKALPWVIIALLSIALATMTKFYLSERDDYTTFRATVAQAQADQLKALNELANQRETNLKEVRKDYEAKVPAIRANAVTTYCLRNPTLCQPAPACESTASVPLDDGAKQEPVACEREFIVACGDDANKLGAWQDYCKRNNCPIEP